MIRSIHGLTADEARRLRFILCDIDDTITSGGKLTAGAYSALWRLSEAGLRVIPVTGRPAGWCDMIIRQWPAAAVVGENGAFALRLSGGRVERLTHPNADPDSLKKLEAVRERVFREVPGVRTASDQFCRQYDLALDFAEEEPFLGLDAAHRIRDICVEMGAEAKISSIHVNAWFGRYSKREMAKLCLERFFGEDGLSRAIFFGDSPNDEPMFEACPLSCAVANIKPFLPELSSPPTFVTDAERADGFVEAAEVILGLILPRS